jgi:uncharacterized BrkB/YihY/UPF0761 family membrane protein
MFGFEFLTYRKGRGGLLATGFAMLILSGSRFYLAASASARHATVSSLWYGEPIMPGQEFGIAVLLLLFGGICAALSLRRAQNGRDSPNV